MGFKDAAILTLRSNWTVGDKTFKAGSMLSLSLESCVRGIFSDMQVLFEPNDKMSLQSSAGTFNYMVISILNNVKTELQYWRYDGHGHWTQHESAAAGGGVPVGCDVSVSAVWPADSDDIWIVRDGYLQPDALQLASAARGGLGGDELKTKPAMFKASGLIVEQLEATSLDGTRVPYFIIRPEESKLDGTLPTLLDGYGGFEIPHSWICCWCRCRMA